jgi:hypothetical protein
MGTAASGTKTVAGTLGRSRFVLAAIVAMALFSGIGGTASAQNCDPSYSDYCVPYGEQPPCDPYMADFPACCAWEGSGDPGFFGQGSTMRLPCESEYPCDGWCD